VSDGTKIEWTEATWNPITGCSLSSPGCTNCYAMLLAGTRLAGHPSRAGLTRMSGGRPKWTGEVRFNDQWLDQPLRWHRPRMIFVCAHGDLFHENVPDEWIDRVFAVMALAPQHTFQVLTKRSARMRQYLSQFERSGRYVVSRTREQIGPDPRDGNRFLLLKEGQTWPLPNVWLGVSTEDQHYADERIADLLQTPAAVRWISAEPLLGPIDLRHLQPIDPPTEIDALAGTHGVLRPHRGEGPKLDWVVVGGESGPAARPADPSWVRSLRDQCLATGVPFFFKQWGEHWPAELLAPRRDGLPWRSNYDGMPAWHANDYGLAREDLPQLRFLKVGKKKAGRELDCMLHDAMPRAAGPEDFEDPNVNDRLPAESEVA
jgi:protein gp37